MEALEPADLRRLLEDIIESVMDMAAYDAETAQERKDAVAIKAMKDDAARFFKGWRGAE